MIRPIDIKEDILNLTVEEIENMNCSNDIKQDICFLQIIFKDFMKGKTNA